MHKEGFCQQAKSFLNHIFQQMHIHDIQLQPHWMIDHVCYRTETFESYLSYKKEFAQWASLLIESEVNGRPIATFKLHEPFVYQERIIPLVELPAPKPNKVTCEGFQHLEVVCDIPFETLKKNFFKCQFDESGLTKPFNQELEIVLKNCSLKFHHLSLASVVRLEKNQKIYHAICNSGILEILRPYHPLLAGEFLLGTEQDNSHLEIHLASQDLDPLATLIFSAFGHCPKFKIHYTKHFGKKTLIAYFTSYNMPFKLCAQDCVSVQQEDYLQFQKEERLLLGI